MNSTPFHIMRVRDLMLRVKLGCSPEERKIPQEVRVGVDLRFAQPPSGTETDKLSDTVCYAQISEALKKHSEENEFCLIERLATELFDLANRITAGQAELSLVVHKVSPPVPGLLGGVDYRIGNFL